MITVILSAGKSTRFANAGYPLQKPMLPMPDGRRLLEWHLERLPTDDKLIFVSKREYQAEQWAYLSSLQLQYPTLMPIWLSKNVKGPLDTAWAVKNHLDIDEPLVISYNDDLVLPHKADSITRGAAAFLDTPHTAMCYVFRSDNPRFGRVKGNQRYVYGPIFVFRSGKSFVAAAKKLPRESGNGIPDVFEALDYPGGLACLCLESSVINLGTWQEYSDWMTSHGHIQHLIGGKE